MKNVLIISPDFLPSTLVGVHRARGLANYLEEFGWHPIVLTVDSKYYKDPVADEMNRLLRDEVEVDRKSVV